MTQSQPVGMSPYEEKAWRAIQDYKAAKAKPKKTLKALVPSPVAEASKKAIDKAGDVWDDLAASNYLETAAAGAFEALSDGATQLIPTKSVVKKYRSAGYPVSSLDDILKLDLSVVDDMTPRLGKLYAIGGAAEGGLTGFLAGGGAVFAAGGAVAGGVGAAPGLSVVLTALMTDVVTTIGGSMIAAGHYGSHAGFDASQDDDRERAFLLGVLGVSSAGSIAAKDLAFTELRQLAMAIARHAPWTELSEKALVKVVEQLFKRLAVRLTKQKLGQTLPILGAGIGASMNYQLLGRVGRDARMLYRERFLIEKYGIEDVPVSIEVIDIAPDDV